MAGSIFIFLSDTGTNIPNNPATIMFRTMEIDIIKERGGRIGVFPVSQGAWKDIGEWKGYLNLINK